MKFRFPLIILGMLICKAAVGQTERTLAAPTTGESVLTGTSTTSVLNAEVHPALCANAVAPSWCSGSDMGAWINAAEANIATPIHTGRMIYVDPGVWKITTPIVLTGEVTLRCAPSGGSVSNPATGLSYGAVSLVWRNSTGIMITAGNMLGQHVEGCLLQGPGSETSTTALSLAQSDYATFRDLNIGNFGIGINFGSNTYINLFENDNLHDNAISIYDPASSVNTGENILFIGGAITQHGSAYNRSCVSIQSTFLVRFFSMSFDQCGIDMNGKGVVVNVEDSHFENPGGSTPMPYITMDAKCQNCQLQVNGGEMGENTISSRTAFISNVSTAAAENIVTVIGGVYGPAEPGVALVNSTQSHGASCFVVGVKRGVGGPVLSSYCGGTWSGINVIQNNATQFGQLLLSNSSTAMTRYARYTAALSPVAVAANTCAAQSVTVTGVQTADIIIKAQKPAEQAGLALVSARATAAGTVALEFCNNSAVSITPTASETYTFVVLQ